MLVSTKGGDALNVCLNTVAILFQCEVDNACYSIGLAEHVRARVETAGRIELSDADRRMLVQSRFSHGIFVWIALVLGVVAQGRAPAGGLTGMYWVPDYIVFVLVAFWLGGALEAFAPGATPMDVTVGVGKTTGKFVTGFVVFIVLYMVAGDLVGG